MRVIFNHNGRTYSGTVDSRANWGPGRYNPELESDWYVEFTHDQQSAGRTGDPGYVKERPDGAKNLRFEE
jgi:hypothetical protein